MPTVTIYLPVALLGAILAGVIFVVVKSLIELIP